MSKPSKDAALNDLASLLFASLLDEIVFDSALQSHQEIMRGRTVCTMCRTRCGEVHVPPATVPTSSLNVPVPPSRASTPTASGIPGTPSKSDGNIYLDCQNCQRQVASNRYASHLSSCMGLGAARRGAARNATTKTKLGSNGARSASPYVDSLNGNISDDAKPAKGKAKAKAGRQSLLAEEDEPLGQRKRPGSPQVPSSKKAKKAKPNASPMSRTSTGRTADADPPRTPTHNSHLAPPGSQTKIPSKLSTPSYPPNSESQKSPSHSRSRSLDSDSSADTPAASGSTPSTPSVSLVHSPTLPAAATIGAGKRGSNGTASVGRGAGRGVPPPPRPSPLPPAPAPIRRMPDPDYLIDVEGEETGSSSDTDHSS